MNYHFKRSSFLLNVIAGLLFNLPCPSSYAQDVAYQLLENLSYYDSTETDPYIRERCKLDLYYPHQEQAFPTIVWFHGGGLKAGEKSIPEELKKQGIAVASVNYRLHPKVQHPAYIEDASRAVVWVFQHIQEYGGDPAHIYVSGHSAGGYLASMVGLDTSWLAKYDINANHIAGLVPFSGHTITHFTIRAERGISGKQPIIDKYAPLFFVRDDAPPLVLITGDRELELLGRYEENAFMWRMMKISGHKATYLHELDGFDHGGMAKPAMGLLLRYVKEWEKQGVKQ